MSCRKNEIFAIRFFNQAEPPDESKLDYLESLIRLDYERCHPDETLDELKHRACFSKEDRGLLRDWMVLAARRATVRDKKRAAGLKTAA